MEKYAVPDELLPILRQMGFSEADAREKIASGEAEQIVKDHKEDSDARPARTPEQSAGKD